MSGACFILGPMETATYPNIYAAESFRNFLADYYRHRKEQNKNFSYQTFSRLLGFKARSYLPLVISGKRNIDPSQIERFSILFNNRQRQFNLFKDLVMFEWVKHPAEKAKIARKILQAKKSQSITGMKFEWYSLYSDWFYFPILYLAKAKHFKLDLEEIQNRMLFPVSPKQVRDAVDTFFKLGLWATRSDGFVELTEKVLTSYQELDRSVLKSYHKNMLELAIRAADLPFNERYLSGTTLTLTQQKFEELADEVHEIKKELYLKYVGASTDVTPANKSEENKKQVYQLSLAIHPLTK
jgi:uncharacterized protein (TIGR02147 family)